MKSCNLICNRFCHNWNVNTLNLVRGEKSFKKSKWPKTKQCHAWWKSSDTPFSLMLVMKCVCILKKLQTLKSPSILGCVRTQVCTWIRIWQLVRLISWITLEFSTITEYWFDNAQILQQFCPDFRLLQVLSAKIYQEEAGSLTKEVFFPVCKL